MCVCCGSYEYKLKHVFEKLRFGTTYVPSLGLLTRTCTYFEYKTQIFY